MVKEIVKLSLDDFRNLSQADRNEALQDLRDQREQLRELANTDPVNSPVDPKAPAVYFTHN